MARIPPAHWLDSSPGEVESRLRGVVVRGPFELLGAEAAQSEVTAFSVVLARDEFEERHARFGRSVKRASIDEPAFERSEFAAAHSSVVVWNGMLSSRAGSGADCRRETSARKKPQRIQQVMQ